MTTLVIVGDGRLDYLDRCIASLDRLHGDFDRKVIVYDEPEAANYLKGRYDGFDVVCHSQRRGLAGAVRSAWDQIGDSEYLFHLEEDFVFVEDVEVSELVKVLRRMPHLAQVVLKRQPWNERETAAGGIIEMDPHLYTDRPGYVEHQRIFSLNPCLIPRSVVEMGWPDGNEAEFTETCVGKGYAFAFYGERQDPPRVHHIGVRRSPGWAL